MSNTNAADAALISNISERDSAKDVEQLDDILRTFINETNKIENRFGKAVKKLMLGSLLNFRFRGTTMSYDEFLITLENIIIDKVAAVPTL